MSKRNIFIPAYLNGIHKNAGKGFTFEMDPSLRSELNAGVPLMAQQVSGVPPRVHRYQQGVEIPQEGSHQYNHLRTTILQGEGFLLLHIWDHKL